MYIFTADLVVQSIEADGSPNRWVPDVGLGIIPRSAGAETKAKTASQSKEGRSQKDLGKNQCRLPKRMARTPKIETYGSEVIRTRPEKFEAGFLFPRKILRFSLT